MQMAMDLLKSQRLNRTNVELKPYRLRRRDEVAYRS